METVALLRDGVLVEQPETEERVIIPYSELRDTHPAIRDAISFRLGYLAALAVQDSANDQGD